MTSTLQSNTLYEEVFSNFPLEKPTKKGSCIQARTETALKHHTGLSRPFKSKRYGSTIAPRMAFDGILILFASSASYRKNARNPIAHRLYSNAIHCTVVMLVSFKAIHLKNHCWTPKDVSATPCCCTGIVSLCQSRTLQNSYRQHRLTFYILHRIYQHYRYKRNPRSPPPILLLWLSLSLSGPFTAKALCSKTIRASHQPDSVRAYAIFPNRVIYIYAATSIGPRLPAGVNPASGQIDIDRKPVVRQSNIRRPLLFFPHRQLRIGGVVLDVVAESHKKGPPRLKLTRQDDTIFDAGDSYNAIIERETRRR